MPNNHSEAQRVRTAIMVGIMVLFIVVVGTDMLCGGCVFAGGGQ